MRVFVTGASGHIASALIPDLIDAGHEVVGLARSEEAATTVKERGAEVRRGDLDDLDVLGEAANDADGVIHLAFNHQFNDLAAASTVDLAATQAMGDALAGSGKPFVTTSGTLLLAMATPGRVGTEQDALPGGYRIDSENYTVGLAERGVRSSVIRLAPLVHSELDHHGFAHRLIAIARAKGVSGYAGDGSNRWTGFNTHDAGRLYRLALEKGPAGSRFHGVEDEGVPFIHIAELIGRKLDVPVAPIGPDDVAGHFDFLATFVGLDSPASNEWTRQTLDWEPTHPGLLDDLDRHYFG